MRTLLVVLMLAVLLLTVGSTLAASLRPDQGLPVTRSVDDSIPSLSSGSLSVPATPANNVQQIGHAAWSDSDDWSTSDHAPGTCAMYGVCGLRPDGDPLNCPRNIPAPVAEPQAEAILSSLCPSLWASSGGKLCCSGEQAATMQRSLRMAEPFIISCPACMHNFRNLFCSLFCSPDQATFTNVTAVQQARTQRGGSATATAVQEVAFYLSDEFKEATYDSCKDVIFGAANQRSMTYIGGGATSAQEFVDFLGTVKDKAPSHMGSPIQLNFPAPPPASPSSPIRPWRQTVPTCWDDTLKCSCGDCPTAPACELPPDPPPDHEGPRGCAALNLGWTPISCVTAAAWLPGALALAALLWAYGSGWMSRAATSVPSSAGVAAEDREIPLESSDFFQPSSRTSNALSHDGDPRAPSRSSLSNALLPRAALQAANAAAPRPPFAQRVLSPAFHRLGARVATYPQMTLLISICCIALCTAGLVYLDIETEPLKLWMPPASRAAHDKAAYEAAFGPFYRIEQLVLSTRPGPDGVQPAILTDEHLALVFDIHSIVDGITVASHCTHGNNVTLASICYKPFGDACATQSVAQYWQLDRGKFDSHYVQLDYCLSHWSTECRSAFKAPIEPKMVLGGYPTDASFRSYLQDTTALLITFPVDARRPMPLVKSWEAEFLNKVETIIQPRVEAAGLALSYSSEASVPAELARESFLDVSTVALSYLAMLVYIAIALAKAPPPPARRGPWDAADRLPSRAAAALSLVVHSRASLGLAGVAIVFASVLGALGVCSAAGVTATLIIMEVIPFLVLAIGVDNMFILALLEAQQPPWAPIADRMATTLAAAGPSITMATLAEVLAFAVAATTAMPAVRNFAVVAMVAVLLDYGLQVTAFVALLTLDARRVQAGYADCVPCLQAVAPRAPAPSRDFEIDDDDDGDGDEDDELALYDDDGSAGARKAAAGRVSAAAPLERALAALHRRVLTPPVAKLAVLAAFLAAALASVSLLERVSVGLDQAVALPRDSYLQAYYRDVLHYARVGPPVMFVVERMNVSLASPDVRAVCASAGCADDSLLGSIAAAAQRPHLSYLATPAASWVDDFAAWVRPELPDCCREHTQGASRGDFCPAEDAPPCSEHPAECRDCSTCLCAADLPQSRPSLAQTQRLLPWFLQAEPTARCAKGGRGVYTDAIAMTGAAAPPPRGQACDGAECSAECAVGGQASSALQGSAPGPGPAAGAAEVVGLREGVVTSYFRALSAPLSQQRDFTAALAASRAIVDGANAALAKAHAGAGTPPPTVYAYSIFHPFFEQYLTIPTDATRLLAAACLVVCLVCVLFTGSPALSAIIAFCLASLLLNMLGAMALAGIQLNAVSLVNLAMAMGIGVEFLAHVAHAFAGARGSRDDRVGIALRERGAAVCSGIMLTKLVGVAMLAFSQTQIFEVYYFRMYLSLVVLGSLHGLLLLPVLLSLVGPPELPLPRPPQRREAANAEFYAPVTNRPRYIISRSGTSESGSVTAE